VKHFALDSSILIYAEGADDDKRREIAASFIAHIGHNRIVLPVQAAGETLNWLVRKGGFSKNDAVTRIRQWLELCIPVAVTPKVFRAATSLVAEHDFQMWDAVIVASGAEAGATYLLSEDMQHGFGWSNIVILNPFILSNAERHALATEIPLQ
jgi:predicted nucleic acid-binding protein